MPGPLANVGTIVAGITLDVNRLLYMGQGKTMEFLTPDMTQPDNWRVRVTLSSGFDRIVDSADEKTTGDGTQVTFHVADIGGGLSSILGLQELHVRVEDIIYSVARVPKIASSEAQVYVLICKVRTIRNKFFDNGKK